MRQSTLISSSIPVLAMLAIGCASGPPQTLTSQLARADASIAQAEQTGAPQGGLPELNLARDKRAQAQDALVRRKYDESMRLAEQAQLDAQYAGIKSQAERALTSVDEVRRGTQTLRSEAQRNATP